MKNDSMKNCLTGKDILGHGIQGNTALEEIARKISEAKSVMLFPHVNPDGDALGSCAALCKALRDMGKETWILLEDDIPANLRFLDKGYCTWDEDRIHEPDICMCVDCSDTGRFEKRAEKFIAGKTTVCIDHHRTGEAKWDYSYIDPSEAATGQIVFSLIKKLGVEPDKEIGEAIFAAVTTDTGNFQYSNTQSKSHLIAAELYKWGVDCNYVSVQLYENVSLERFLIRNKAMETLRLLGDGRGAVVYVTQKMLDETGALMEETEGLSQDLRSIAGVEFAAVVKEYEEEKIKVSMRAKSRGDVAAIAAKLGGGGHTKAAGCTIYKPVMEAVKLVEEEILLAIDRLRD